MINRYKLAARVADHILNHSKLTFLSSQYLQDLNFFVFKFPKDLDWRNSTGRVLSLNLKCANGTTSFPACFIFKVSGILIIEGW